MAIVSNVALSFNPSGINVAVGLNQYGTINTNSDSSDIPQRNSPEVTAVSTSSGSAKTVRTNFGYYH